jgi:hypothetical protein
MYSKEDKLILISQMPENPSLPEKLDFLKKIFDLRFPNSIKKITRENLCDSNNQRTVNSLYAEHTTPEKIDAMEVSRLYFLEQAKKENQKKCLNCSNVRNQDEFVKYWKQCIFCLDMTVEEANEKGAERDKLKSEGVKCSTCKSHKHLNEFSIKKDGNHSKTCIKCADKKKKKPEETPEPSED